MSHDSLSVFTDLNIVNFTSVSNISELNHLLGLYGHLYRLKKSEGNQTICA